MHDPHGMVYYACGDVPTTNSKVTKMDHSVDQRVEVLDAKIEDQRLEIESLKGKLAETERNKEYYYEAWNAARAEIAQLHQTIDLLPNSPPRSSEPPEDQQWNKIDYTVANRLTAWVATLIKR